MPPLYVCVTRSHIDDEEEVGVVVGDDDDDDDVDAMAEDGWRWRD